MQFLWRTFNTKKFHREAVHVKARTETPDAIPKEDWQCLGNFLISTCTVIVFGRSHHLRASDVVFLENLDVELQRIRYSLVDLLTTGKCLENGAVKSFRILTGQICQIQDMRSVQGHSFETQLQNNELLSCDWTDFCRQRWIYVCLQACIRKKSHRKWSRSPRGAKRVLLYGCGSHETSNTNTSIRSERADATSNKLRWRPRAQQMLVVSANYHQCNHVVQWQQIDWWKKWPEETWKIQKPKFSWKSNKKFRNPTKSRVVLDYVRAVSQRDPNRPKLNFHFIKQLFQSRKKRGLMQELTKDQEEYLPLSVSNPTQSSQNKATSTPPSVYWEHLTARTHAHIFLKANFTRDRTSCSSFVTCCQTYQKHSTCRSCCCWTFLRQRFLIFLFTCDFSDVTWCLTCAINCKQTTTLRFFDGEGTNSLAIWTTPLRTRSVWNLRTRSSVLIVTSTMTSTARFSFKPTQIPLKKNGHGGTWNSISTYSRPFLPSFERKDIRQTERTRFGVLRGDVLWFLGRKENWRVHWIQTDKTNV